MYKHLTILLIVIVFFASCKQEKKAIKATADDIISIYMQNQVKADEAFKGKILIVSGSVLNIRKNIQDQPYFILKGNGFNNIQCFTDTETAAKIEQGNNVYVKGKCLGMQMNVVLRDCVLVSSQSE